MVNNSTESVDTAKAPAKQRANAAALPFAIASRVMSRLSIANTTVLGAGNTPTTPIQIPAVGFLRRLQLKFTMTFTAGTAFPADGPFALINSIEFRTAAGNQLIVPVTGYQLYLMNKYGHPQIMSPYSDPKFVSYSTTSGTAASFYLDIPFEIDPETGLGSIPALASNRNYQLGINYRSYSTVTGATAGSVTVEAVAHYWTEPPASSASGLGQETQPQGLGTISQWLLETPSVNSGASTVTLHNTGNFMRNIIFVARNAAGARTEADWPALTEFILDNESMFYLPKDDWRFAMRRQFGLTASAMDAPNGIDSGVFVLPFDTLVGSLSGDPANSRSQYLPTLDSSQLQIKGSAFGAGISTVEILTNNITPSSSGDVFSK